MSCSGEMRAGRRRWYGEKTGDAHGTSHSANAARCIARRHADGGEVRRVDDAARTGQADALRGNQHLGAIAASTQGAVRRVRPGKKGAQAGGGEQRRALWGVGGPVDPAPRLRGRGRGVAATETAMSVK